MNGGIETLDEENKEKTEVITVEEKDPNEKDEEKKTEKKEDNTEETKEILKEKKKVIKIENGDTEIPDTIDSNNMKINIINENVKDSTKNESSKLGCRSCDCIVF